VGRQRGRQDVPVAVGRSGVTRRLVPKATCAGVGEGRRWAICLKVVEVVADAVVATVVAVVKDQAGWAAPRPLDRVDIVSVAGVDTGSNM
jgi:hypothetical protein